MAHIEWDNDAWSRKYVGCWTVLTNKNTGAKTQAYIVSFANATTVSYAVQDEPEKIIHRELSDVSLEYLRLDAGYYPVKWIYSTAPTGAIPKKINSIGFIGVKRKAVKSYLQGYTTKTYLPFSPETGASGSSFLKFLPCFLKENGEVGFPDSYPIEQSLQSEGPISSKFYLTEFGVYYLDFKVGTRSKKKFFVHEFYKTEVEECLSPHKCSVLPY